jgi:beta-N-acetylhexosaminidase
MGYQQIAALYAAHMTLDEELGQMFMVSYDASTYSPDLDRMLGPLHAGGVVLYQAQIKTLTQMKHDVALMQKRAQLPLLISTDEEGGYVDRLVNIYPPRPSALSIYRTGDTGVATQMGQQTAQDLLALGINENLAPDSDVQLVDGPDQLTRTFGFTPQSVIAFAGAYMQALQQNHVIACIKHFPGLGSATIDAHLALPIVRRTKTQLYTNELAPFKAFVQAQNAQERPGMVMSTDVLMPAIDPQFPAELSHIFITDILRKQFGYNGVVITDALSMQGISNHWDISQASVMALNAGNDMLIGISTASQMADTIGELKSALQRGALTKTRIDEAVIRILSLKLQYHLLPTVHFSE